MQVWEATLPPRDTPIRVVLVDDYAVVLECFPPFMATLADDIAVVGVAGSGAAALDVIADLRPDIVLLGLTLPDVSGLEVAQQVLETQPAVKIVAFTRHDDPATVQRLQRLGLSGCIAKRTTSTQIVAAIRAVVSGYDVWPPRRERSAVVLTDRQTEVLALLGAGQHNADIAAALNIEQRTVEYHVHNLFLKLDVHTRVEVVLKAEEQGLL